MALFFQAINFLTLPAGLVLLPVGILIVIWGRQGGND